MGLRSSKHEGLANTSTSWACSTARPTNGEVLHPASSVHVDCSSSIHSHHHGHPDPRDPSYRAPLLEVCPRVAARKHEGRQPASPWVQSVVRPVRLETMRATTTGAQGVAACGNACPETRVRVATHVPSDGPGMRALATGQACRERAGRHVRGALEVPRIRALGLGAVSRRRQGPFFVAGLSPRAAASQLSSRRQGRPGSTPCSAPYFSS